MAEERVPGGLPNDPTIKLSLDMASGLVPADGTLPPLAPSALEERLLSEAVNRGMITAIQARSVIEAPSGPREVTKRLVERGLMQEGEVRSLEQAIKATIVPGYEVLGELGRGGMGVVYKARQARLDRTVALKVVAPEAATQLEFMRRFEQEAKALARLNHPNIVQVYDYGEQQGRLYIALEFVDGRDCSREMELEGRFPRAKALAVVKDAALGLRQAHRSGIIHRDVKPGNVLLVRGPGGELTAKVTDLGLARLSGGADDGRLTRAGTVMGSPAYMAPEQSRAEAADHRSDIYGLGATLYHMLGGEVPFAAGGGSVLTILSRKLTQQLDLPKLAPGSELDEGLIRLLDRMLARRPEDRYQSWDDVVADLEALQAGREPRATRVDREHSSLKLGGPGRAATGRPAAGKPDLGAPVAGGGSPLPILIGVVALGLVAGAAFLLFRPDPAGSGGKTTGPGPAPDLGQLTAGEVARGIEALEKLAPEQRLADEGVIAALQSQLATLPAGDQVTWRPRLKAMLQQAVEATESARLFALEEPWSKGEWEELARRASAMERDYARWGADLPTRARELSGFARTAAEGGAGAAERAAWKAAATTPDPLVVLAELERFEERFPWSPNAAEAAAKRAEAAAKAPVLTLEAEPAGVALEVDGRDVGAAPWKGNVLAGSHRIRAQAAGHAPLELELAVSAPLTRKLVLGPLPAKALRRDPVNGRPLVQGPVYTRSWALEKGEWKGTEELGGLWLGGKGWNTARRDCGQILERLMATGAWSLQWQLDHDAGTSGIAEVRALESGDGRSAVLGWRAGGNVYFGIRKGPNEDGLEVRYEATPGPDGPGFFQLDWDGQVLDARTKAGRLGTLALPWTPASQCFVLGVQDGGATFRDMEVRPLIE